MTLTWQPAVEAPPVDRRSGAVLAVHVIRNHAAEHAAMQAATYADAALKQRIRRLCERNICDSLARQILDILDEPAVPNETVGRRGAGPAR